MPTPYKLRVTCPLSPPGSEFIALIISGRQRLQEHRNSMLPYRDGNGPSTQELKLCGRKTSGVDHWPQARMVRRSIEDAPSWGQKFQVMDQHQFHSVLVELGLASRRGDPDHHVGFRDLRRAHWTEVGAIPLTTTPITESRRGQKTRENNRKLNVHHFIFLKSW